MGNSAHTSDIMTGMSSCVHCGALVANGSSECPSCGELAFVQKMEIDLTKINTGEEWLNRVFYSVKERNEMRRIIYDAAKNGMALNLTVDETKLLESMTSDWRDNEQ